jgi:Leucine-rich repeat (LRR) protein
MFGALTSCIVAIVPVSGKPVKEPPSPAAHVPAGVSPAAAIPKTVTIHFPSRSVGKIILASLQGTYVRSDDAMKSTPIQAKGDVQLSTLQPITMVLNYDGAAKSTFLDSPEMAAVDLVQIDFRNVESANDDTLKYMTHLTRIRRLLMSGTDVTDSGLQYISSMKDLGHIAGGGTLIKGPGLAYLSELPQLVKLEIARSNLKGFKFDHLPTFKKLEMFTVSQSLCDDSVCEFISRQPQLTEIDISKNKITDAGIARLSSLKKLRSMNLCETLITPKCIASLSQMPSLSNLTLILGQLPPDAVAKMRKAMPKCHIELKPVDSPIDSSLFSPLH